MPIKLQKEHVSLSEVLCSQYCRCAAESDVIVPDVKPDVLKILQISSDVTVTQKNVQTDRVYVQGVIRLNILYIPDGETVGRVKSISATQDFSHQLDIKGAKAGMVLSVDAECEPPEYTLINSRKLNVRSKIGLSIKLTVPTEVEIATDIDGDEPVQTSGMHLRLCSAGSEAERDIIIRERLEIPDGKPDIGELLKIDAKPFSSELKIIDGKAAVKGEVRLCLLYGAADEDASVQFAEYTLPFTEILEIDGLAEGMEGEVEYSVKDTYSEISQDSDGDNRMAGIELTLCARVKTFKTVELDAIADAYGLNGELIIERSAYNLEQLIANTSADAAVKETVTVPDLLPELYRICDCTALPNIENISIDNGAVTVSGFVSCSVLYLPNGGELPIAAFSHTIPFSHSFEIAGIKKDSVCDAKSEVGHISFNMNSAREIELRVTVEICLRAVSPGQTMLIDSMEQNEDAETVTIPSMIIYFVQSGDTLWDIAKRYRTTPDAIIEANGKEKEILKPGNRIYIFR